MAPVRIRTERLLLRTAQADDLAGLHRVLSDPRATRFWSTPPHETLAVTRQWLDAMLSIPDGEGEDFVVEAEGRVIGKAGFFRFPEIGFMLHPDMWGRGLMREALAAVISRAFEVHQLPSIEADVDPRNDRCLALLARLGFRETGREARTWQVGDEWCDSVYLALDAGDQCTA
ncbi:GNAT family N-acetyltransferase [Novosphingobium aquimarinum]|uniref:GNAT family N-acetyltransferase n=1 Tax=Novosphingobium aquimarinum TaxID=2682494 RepID=UPI0012EBCC14|nr:GNAT family N-acetyltransferase [Novosphingobium aquimarinum]